MSQRQLDVQHQEVRERNRQKRAEQIRKVEDRVQRLNAGRS